MSLYYTVDPEQRITDYMLTNAYFQTASATQWVFENKLGDEAAEVASKIARKGGDPVALLEGKTKGFARVVIVFLLIGIGRDAAFRAKNPFALKAVDYIQDRLGLGDLEVSSHNVEAGHGKLYLYC